MDKIAKALGVTAEAMKNFRNEAALNYFNTFNDSSTGAFNNFNCTFNPIDEIVELYDEKLALLERLLASEKEKVEILKGEVVFLPPKIQFLLPDGVLGFQKEISVILKEH